MNVGDFPARNAAATLVAAFFLVCTPVGVTAQDEPLPDRRAVPAPIVTPGPTAGAAVTPAARESLVDLLLQVDALQAEVRELRNSVEVQGHELGQLRQRQRDLIEDLDRRVRELEGRAAQTETPSPAAPPALAAPTPEVPAAAPPAAAPAAGPPPRTATAVPPSRLKPATAEQQKEYDAAFELMKQSQYDKAVKAFRQFVARHPEVSLSGNAQYWAAQGSYVQRKYRAAIDDFTLVLERYPGSSKAGDALLKIGFSHYELGEYGKARAVLQDVIARHPGTDSARLAQARLDKMRGEGR